MTGRIVTAGQAIDAITLEHVIHWSERTFGPGERTIGVADHIVRELGEVAGPARVLRMALEAFEARRTEEPDPEPDPSEFVDVAILAIDGLWRSGLGPQGIIDAICAKWAANEARRWPDWRTAAPGRAIEHERT